MTSTDAHSGNLIAATSGMMDVQSGYLPDAPAEAMTTTAAQPGQSPDTTVESMTTTDAQPSQSPDATIESTTATGAQPDQSPDAATEKMSEPDTPAATVSKSCMLCTEEFDGEETIAAQFPFTCGKCSHTGYCLKCIKNWFIDACRDESKMPPKCCVAIPLAIVVGHLNTAQVRHAPLCLLSYFLICFL